MKSATVRVFQSSRDK